MTIDEVWQAWRASPPLQAGTVVAGGLLAAAAVAVLGRRLLARLVAATSTELDDIAVDAIRRPLATSVAALAAGYALTVAALPEDLTWTLRAVLLTGVTAHWTLDLGRGAGRMLDWLSKHQERFDLVTPRTLPVFDFVAKTVLWGGAAYFVLLSWNVDVTGWLASAGILGVAVGFASQDTLSNLVAGVFILADAPYKLGDWLVLDNGDRGTVTEIGLRTTRLVTRDDVEVIVPNKLMANARIVNQSGGPQPAFRVRVPFSVGYGCDVVLVHREVVALAVGAPYVAPNPEPRVRFRTLGDSGLQHELLVWIDNPRDRGLVTHELNTRLYLRLRELGVELPFPKRDVYLHHPTPEEPT